MPIEKRGAVAIARSFLDIRLSPEEVAWFGMVGRWKRIARCGEEKGTRAKHSTERNSDAGRSAGTEGRVPSRRAARAAGQLHRGGRRERGILAAMIATTLTLALAVHAACSQDGLNERMKKYAHEAQGKLSVSARVVDGTE